MLLRKVNADTINEIIVLMPYPDQKGFVATNTESILEAYTTIIDGGIVLPFGIYEEDTPIGFVMIGYDKIKQDDPAIATHNYCLWRFMIEKDKQGKGYGKQALQCILSYIETMPCGDAQYCWLSYEPDNQIAKNLYQRFGFIENGEICNGEMVAIFKLKDHKA